MTTTGENGTETIVAVDQRTEQGFGAIPCCEKCRDHSGFWDPFAILQAGRSIGEEVRVSRPIPAPWDEPEGAAKDGPKRRTIKGETLVRGEGFEPSNP